MNTFKNSLRLLILLLLGWQSALAQVTYKIDIDPSVTSTIRYRVFMTSAQSYTGTNDIISTAQVTILIPNGGTPGASVNYVANVVGRTGKTPSNLSQQMSWNPAVAGGPTENPQLDYLSFGFSYSNNPVSFSITANQPMELFHFDYMGTCPGPVSLIESYTSSPNPDPFLTPNSLGTNPGNQITVYGYGTQNAYAGNILPLAECRTAFPDLRPGIAGPANLLLGGTATYTISTSNVGAASTVGIYSTTVTLPATVSFVSGAGAGWAFTSTVLANGSTQVVATALNTVISAGGGKPFSLNVFVPVSAPSASVAIGVAVGGGSEINVSNNITSQPIILGAAANADLVASIAGPAGLVAGGTGSYVVSLTNIGGAATSGAYSTTVSLPAGVTLSSGSGAGWGFTTTLLANGTTQVVATASAAIAQNGTAAFTLNVGVSGAALAITTTIDGVVGGGGEVNTSNNTFVQNITITAAAGVKPDLTVAMTGPSLISVGVPVNYLFAVTNSASGPTTGPSILTIPLPAGVSYIGAIGNGWACALTSTPAVSCTYAAVIPGGQSAPNLSLGVSAASPLAGNSFNLQGSVSTPGEVITSNNSTGPRSVSVGSASAGQADLSTTVMMSNQAPNQYEAITATIVVTNPGPASASGVTAQVTLPSGYPITAVQSAGGTTFTSGNGAWTIGTLGAGQSVTLTVTMSAATSGQATVASSVTSTGNNDPVADNNSAQTCFSVPFNLCSGGSFAASIPGTYATIQWFRNGTPINNATTNTLVISQDGTYTVSTTGGVSTCASGACCPIYVRQATDCCAPSTCIPITIRKTR
jgi:uncharacterized repeat protein (TIGR01451 family)